MFARIALLDNGKEFSDDVVNAIGTVLKQRFGVKVSKAIETGLR